MLLPFVLGFSPHLPVSVCGTGTSILFNGFSCQKYLANSLLFFTLPCSVCFSSCTLNFLFCVPIKHYISVVQESFTCYPSDTPCGLSLGPDLPWADEPSPGNLRFSTERILTFLSLLIPAFSLLSRPHVFSVMLLPTIECSSTTDTYVSIQNFGVQFSPGNFRRNFTRPVSYYALFK